MSDTTPRLNSARRQVLDYSDRRVKLRVFISLAAIMLVAALIEGAWNREAWQWLGQLDRAPQAEKFDNRLHDPKWRTASDPAGTFVAQTEPKSVSSKAQPSAQVEPVERAWTKSWQEVLAKLSAAEKSLLFEMFHAGTGRHSVPIEKAPVTADLLATIQRHWDGYQAAAFQSVAELKDEDRSQWVEVLKRVNTRFADDALPALTRVSDAGSLPTFRDVDISALRTTLVALARAEIQDDTIVFRPAEQDIWFHELSRVQDRAAASPPATRVAYLQLYKQPAEYRGQFVTIKGTVRLAYRVPASQNYLGIKEYYVYWIHPAGGPDSPFLVYALGAPPGFPAVTPRAAGLGQSAGTLHEDVEVTGIFFKRSAYAAKGGTYTAPLLIASQPKWLRSTASNIPARVPFSLLELAAGAIGALVLATCLATVLWKRSRRTAADRTSAGLVDLGQLTIGPTAEEGLRALERQARSEGNG